MTTLFSRLKERWARVWFYPRVGLQTKMTIIVIVGIIALVGIFAYIGIAALNENIQRSLQERVVVAQTAARHIDYTLADIEHVMTQEARQDGLLDPLRRAAMLQQIFSRDNFYGSHVYIADRNGHVIAAYPPDSSGVDFSDAAAVQSVLQGKPFAVSGRAHSIGMPTPSPLAAAALRDSASNIVGALVISIDLNSPNLHTFTDPVGLGGSGYMDLVDMDGVILASTQANRIGQSSDHNTTLAKGIQSQQTFVSRCHNCHSPITSEPYPQVLAFAPLQHAQWGVTVRQDEDEVVAAARDLQWRIFGLGAVALAGALVLVYLTTRSVILPVQALTAATQRIAAGDLDTPMEARGQDEIAALARSFDTMRSKLKQSIADIQAWNRDLDARVQERTAALSAAQRATQESRDHLQTVIDGLSDELLVIDRSYRVTQVNAAVQRRLAGKPIDGSFCYDLTHANCPCQSPDCECPVPTVVQTRRPVRVTHVHCNPADGNLRYVEITASPLFDAEGQVNSVVEMLRDVTEEKRLEETLRQRNRELLAVNAIARVVGQSLKLDECLQSALSEVQRITRVEVGSIYLLEGEDRALKLRVCCGMSEESAEAAGRMALTDVACGGVLQVGEPVVVQNLAQTTRASYGALQREALSSLVHVPLLAKGTPVGTLCLGARDSHQFTDEEISLLSAIGSQIAIAVENAQLYEELSRKEQLRGELLRRIISVQEDERKRIARELHDETSQTLTALLYALDGTGTNCRTPETAHLLDKMRRLTLSSIDSVHKVIFDLRPTMLDQLGLIAALRWYAESHLAESGTRVQVSEFGGVRRLPSVVETALFRTVQEAINNVARHAGARHLQIVFDFPDHQVEIRVEDDGIGFDLKRVRVSPNSLVGLGLLSMHERMSAVGGEFFLDSAPGQGTVVLLRVPIPEGEA